MLTTSLVVALAFAAEPSVSVTIYSTADVRGFDPQQFAAQQRLGNDPTFAWQVPGFGIVRETRTVPLKVGTNDLPFSDVAAFIDPTTVSFTDLTDAKTKVLEQNFQFDLVSPSKLLEKYVGQTIEVVTQEGTSTRVLTGTLLSANQGQLVITHDKGLTMIPSAEARVSLPALPDGLLTKPTLLWKLDAKSDGDHTIRTSYQTAGMTWRADYNLVLNADDTAADLTPWVTLMNVSGTGFKNAQLKLIAGDVQTLRPEAMPKSGRMQAMRGASAGDDEGFHEEALFEYHLYTLPRATDVLANTSQQIALFPPVSGVTVKKQLVYVGIALFSGYDGPVMIDRDLGGGGNKKVGVFVTLKNDEASKLGMPLPKGRVRVYKTSGGASGGADGSVEFVGEDIIDHTPKNETIKLKLGDSFDVTGERVQTDFKVDSGRKEMIESFKITLKNAKPTAQTVEVREPLYRWSNWEITAKSAAFQKLDARTISWSVIVPASGSATIEYTVRYTW
ncbi:MAG: DUF4139 domain-containing protein [Phycisphaerae bacterium]|nr:DUF4139 domain-containing protein [Phycisphaerae bacterium]